MPKSTPKERRAGDKPKIVATINRATIQPTISETVICDMLISNSKPLVWRAAAATTSVASR